jgi:phenylalanyl-tRNA synthetase beta chain
LLRCGKVVGTLGMLHPALAKALDLAEDVFAFELDLEPVVGRPIPRAGDLSPFPSIHRDLSFEIAVTVPYAAIEAAVRAAAGPTLKQVVLFDEYTGRGLAEGLRSLAMGLILQDDSRTLTDSDAEQSVGAVVERLAAEFGARLRS